MRAPMAAVLMSSAYRNSRMLIVVVKHRRDLLHSPRRTQIGVADSKPGPTLPVVKIERLVRWQQQRLHLLVMVMLHSAMAVIVTFTVVVMIVVVVIVVLTGVEEFR